MSKKLITNEFIEKAREIHGDRYDYSKVNYVNKKTEVSIICLEHGDFEQTPHAHLRGEGCPSCGGSIKYTKETFAEKAKRIHHNRYSYDKVNYINNTTKVIITCPEHGDFEQTPANHLKGERCPTCAKSSHLEDTIRNLLINNNINFKEQYTWDWLIFKRNQKVDFYLLDFNTIIECQGEQHFFSNKHFGGENNYKNTIERDKNKLKLCTEHNIKVLYFSNMTSIWKDFQYPYKVFEDTDELLKEILI